MHKVPRVGLCLMSAHESCVIAKDSKTSVHGILQARVLEWEVIPFSKGFSQFMDQTQVSCTAGGFFTI